MVEISTATPFLGFEDISQPSVVASPCQIPAVKLRTSCTPLGSQGSHIVGSCSNGGLGHMGRSFEVELSGDLVPGSRHELGKSTRSDR